MKQYRNIKHTQSAAQQFPTKLLAIVIGILALIILITLFIQSCTEEKTYNWDNLYNENGRIYYQENGVTTSLTGIDVSSHQGPID